MSDLERRLEDLFMHDSRARRVVDANIPARQRSPLRGVAFVGAAALSVLALVVAVSTLRGPQVTSPAFPPNSASPSSTSHTTTPPGPTATSQPTASPSGNTQPDGRHGFLSQTGPERVALRTEQDATPLVQLSPFSGAAVSPDGRRLAMLRQSETGQQLVWGQATRFAEARVVADLSGSGEFATSIVWAVDNSNSIAFTVMRPSGQQGVDPPPLYSALRSVDLETGAIRELVRTSNERILVPLIWRPRDNVAAASEIGAGGFASSYVIVRGGQIERTAFDLDQGPLGLQADREGTRVLGLFGRSNELFLKWWNWDRPDQTREMRPPAGEGVFNAAWRPGSDEIGVEVMSSAPRPTPARGRFELWSVATDARRVVAASGGFEMFRQDGTAAIGVRGFSAPFEIYLIDLSTGATSPIPSSTQTDRPMRTAVLF